MRRSILALLVSLLATLSNAAPRVHHGVYVDPSGQTRRVAYLVVNGRAIFQGDIDLGPVDKAGNLLRKPDDIATAVGTVEVSRVWPDCVVPIEFDSNVGPALRGMILAGIGAWTTASTCTFPTRTTEKDWMVFVAVDGSRSSSPVGRYPGQQQIFISRKASARSVAHELGHTLGLFHEHARHDRDMFVDIQWGNIAIPDDFKIDPTSADIGLYDFGSIMHYGPTIGAKSPGLTTIVSLVPGAIFGVGPLDTEDVSGAMEVQALHRGWSFFEAPSAAPADASPVTLGPMGEAFYYTPFKSGGKDFGRLSRRPLPWFPPAIDIATTLPPEPIRGYLAAAYGQRPIGEAAIFALGGDTLTYMEFRRDFKSDAAGGAFRLATASIGNAWASSPAAINLDNRLFVFGVRPRDDAPTPADTAVHFAHTQQDLTMWTAPIALPTLPSGHKSSAIPAVVSTRPGIWTLFILDNDNKLFAIEGDRDGKVVTPWTFVSDLTKTVGVANSDPSVSITAEPSHQIVVVIRGRNNHLYYCGVDAKLTQTDAWHDVGGLLTSRPSVFGSLTGAYVVSDIQATKHWFRYWRP